HLTVNETQEEALNIFRKYDRAALAVVDSNGVLVGIVTQDDMLDVAEEEATEDIQKIGGMEALDEPYTTIPFPRMVKKRATWLIILFLGEMLTATAMQGYNSEIERAAILAMFLQLIISSGGNSGSQATMLVIRAMLPVLVRRCGLDPAASSAPFVATLVDVTGLVIYFNVALFILRGTLL